MFLFRYKNMKSLLYFDHGNAIKIPTKVIACDSFPFIMSYMINNFVTTLLEHWVIFWHWVNYEQRNC